jgi:formylglycine-generating enzyme required for sulfatase activity
MSPKSSESEETGLLIRPGSGLAILPDGCSPVLSEIITRSLVHIQTNKALAVHKRQPGDEWEFEIAPGVNLVMCWIPPGEFLMGSTDDEWDEEDYVYTKKVEPEHLVRITQGFWLANTQTTQAQWQAVMGSNPSHFQGEYLPVEQVSWNDICGNESGTGGFLGALNRQVPAGGRFHLPTEAQWEYACRAGTTDLYAFVRPEKDWYDTNNKTHPVGQKKPNAWGLHDMLGNVWEWCADWYGNYDMYAVTDPTGPCDGCRQNTCRVIRGGYGSFNVVASRADIRNAYSPGDSNYNIGFRLARGQS